MCIASSKMGRKFKNNRLFYPRMLRKPIITILGHVDHGKTKLLDTIRRTTVVDREAGAITQAIGASIVPLETIQRLCGDLLKVLNIEIKIPGLLFIDTPGHAAFTNLRKRGGNLADIAILVIDINEGFMPQTLEALEILKKYKTPFVVAVNKIDLVSGWKQQKLSLLQSIASQSAVTQELLDRKLYEVVAKFYELGFEAERFDRVSDHTKQLALVPICAKSGEGIPELLMVASGLVQKYLEKNLTVESKAGAKGTILEIKDEKGLGTTLDIIIYEGKISVGDTLIIGTLGEPLVRKIKALFEPEELTEMRDKKGKFRSVKEVYAATGVKVAAPELEGVIAGMPVRVAKDAVEQIKQQVQAEVEEVLIATDKEGILVKADTLGSLEAMITLLRERKIKIRKATIGEISRKDLMEVQPLLEKNLLEGIILGFNVTINKDVEELLPSSGITVLTNQVIYRLIEDFVAWLVEKKKKRDAGEVEQLVFPCKLEIMKNHTFRQSNPAIVGVDILAGRVRTGLPLMKDGKKLTSIKSMKHEKDNLKETKAPIQLAMGLEGVTMGRQLHEGDVLYSFLSETQFRQLKDAKKHLNAGEIEALKEIAEIMRKVNPMWGV